VTIIGLIAAIMLLAPEADDGPKHPPAPTYDCGCRGEGLCLRGYGTRCLAGNPPWSTWKPFGEERP
jgi:hypothetical protein